MVTAESASKQIRDRILLLQTLFTIVTLLPQTLAFSPSSRSCCTMHGRTKQRSNYFQSYRVSSSRVHNNQGNQFDISKPTFDLLSFRLIRSDALLRYNSLNQSEPLRINLFLLATISLLGYPLWCESVTGNAPSIPSSLGAAGIGLGCAALFWRERSRRSNQLRRMEKELNAGNLVVRLPVNTAISSVRPQVRLEELRSKRRVVAIWGSKHQLESSRVLNTLCVLRRRLIQSQTLVVLIPTDETCKADLGLDSYQIGDALWLGEPCNTDEWDKYFGELVENPTNELVWFAINFKGRSIASGLSEGPRLFELLGQQLQPMEILDTSDEAELLEGENMSIAKQILEKQQQFYKLLTNSDDAIKMQAVYSGESADEINEVCFVYKACSLLLHLVHYYISQTLNRSYWEEEELIIGPNV